ncbi:MAG: aminopeptidase P family protein, partial [Rhodospirillaceae bacterium]|nr:aminopeptidase P family protein [Rhodospirillaceae bacterium]
MNKPRVSGTFDRINAEPVELAFPKSEYQARWVKAKAMMEAEGIDILYATSPAHMCWLHGYFAAWYRTHAPSNWGACLGTALCLGWDEPIHFDAIGEDALLYKTSVAEDMRFFDDRSPEGQPPFIVRELQSSGLIKPGTRVGMEFRSFQPNRWVQETIEAAFRAAGCEVVDASMILREARRVKSPAELAHIEQAMRVCEKGHEAAQRTIRPAITELDVEAEMACAMYHAGGELSAIPLMIQSGNTIGGHQMPRRRVLKSGEHIKIDCSGVWFRYHGNILRGYWTGEPPAEVRDRYRRSAGSWDVFAKEARAGRPVREVNAELRRYYQDCGFEGKQSGWCIGYELG